MTQPNILFIMSDDHAAHAISCCGSQINRTPNIDRIAAEGQRLTDCFCTNSICAPSRAVILTGKHSHINGVRTLGDRFDGRQPTFPKMLQAADYQTAIMGKWHLGEGGHSAPTGFDHWTVLPGQGDYHDPVMLDMGEEKVFPGYVTDIITDLSIQWLERRDPNRPFLLMCHHKAPHRSWEPDAKHVGMYHDESIPLPETLHDNYQHRSRAAMEAAMRIERDFNYRDLKLQPPAGVNPRTTIPVPDDLTDFYLQPLEANRPVMFSNQRELKEWLYQRYIKDYLRCVASIDDNVGRLLDYLDEEGLTENTLVIYTSDQGFFLGDHGWYDKRFMYEESLRMPFLVRYPAEIAPGTVSSAISLNLDFAATFLDYAGVEIPSAMQGKSLRPIFAGEQPDDWRDGFYYRYWMHLGDHNVSAHYGLRTDRYKLIYYYGQALDAAKAIDQPKPPEWEVFDLAVDPHELKNVYYEPNYHATVRSLKAQLQRLQAEAGDMYTLAK